MQLVGVDGEVLDALQELTRMAVYRVTGERSRLMLDVGGYRLQRRADLVGLAKKVVAEVTTSGEPMKLEPMNPFERKIIHDTVAEAGLRSESEGEEGDRSVVVFPASPDT
jgi:spoIIIJ-associated protein